jgi:hypothetical protein
MEVGQGGGGGRVEEGQAKGRMCAKESYTEAYDVPGEQAGKQSNPACRLYSKALPAF